MQMCLNINHNSQLCAVFAGYVLMQRIFPLPQKTAFLRTGSLQVMPSISELGVYGTFLAYGDSAVAACAAGGAKADGTVFAALSTVAGVLLSEYGGYLLRTKPDGVDEGGVASGYSVLNSIILD